MGTPGASVVVLIYLYTRTWCAPPGLLFFSGVVYTFLSATVCGAAAVEALGVEASAGAGGRGGGGIRGDWATTASSSSNVTPSRMERMTFSATVRKFGNDLSSRTRSMRHASLPTSDASPPPPPLSLPRDLDR